MSESLQKDRVPPHRWDSVAVDITSNATFPFAFHVVACSLFPFFAVMSFVHIITEMIVDSTAYTCPIYLFIYE